MDRTQDPVNIGRDVNYWGNVWKIIGLNYLGDYEVVRFEDRPNGRCRIRSSCVLGLPQDHPHYAELVPMSLVATEVDQLPDDLAGFVQLVVPSPEFDTLDEAQSKWLRDFLARK